MLMENGPDADFEAVFYDGKLVLSVRVNLLFPYLKYITASFIYLALKVIFRNY